MKYTAVIIEPRIHNALQFVLENFLNNLDLDWSFIIFYGTENKEFLFNIIKENFLEFKNRIRLINLNVNNLAIKDYNNILFDNEFYKIIPTKYFLIFQTDSLIRNKFKHFINFFLKYDYVGAPWPDPVKIFGVNDCNHVGNGGLSLRNKDKMLEIINNHYNKSFRYNEDYFFCKKRNDIELNLPTLDEATSFSIEHIYNDESFGVHKPWNYLSKENYDKLIKISPEIYHLELLNKEYNKKKNIIKKPGNIEFIEENLI
jgi:hypothetical protein